MSALNRLTETQFFLGIAALFVGGVAWILLESEAFVVELLRIGILEVCGG